MSMTKGTLKFTKMHGLGNDYVYIDCFKEQLPNDLDLSKLAIAISDRRFGVGGDGLVLIQPTDNAHCRMRMFNADGSEGKMCGNAIRCIGRYVYEEGHVCEEDISVETRSGIKSVKLELRGGEVTSVACSLGKVSFVSSDLPFLNEADSALGASLEVDGRKILVNCASVGNPHCVIFVDKIEEAEFLTLGPRIEKHSAFPEGVNVEFIRILSADALEMRVWERGSGETLACGTGAGASWAVAHKLGHVKNSGVVQLRGGNLAVSVTTDWEVITSGDTVRVFDGEFYPPDHLYFSR